MQMTFRKESIIHLLRSARDQQQGVDLRKDEGVYLSFGDLANKVFVRGCNPAVNLSYRENALRRFGDRTFSITMIPLASVGRLLDTEYNWSKLVIHISKIRCSVSIEV